MTQTYQASDLQSPIARRPMPPLALGHEDSTIFGLVIRGSTVEASQSARGQSLTGPFKGFQTLNDC